METTPLQLILSSDICGHRLSLDGRNGAFRVNCNSVTRAIFPANGIQEAEALADAVAFYRQMEIRSAQFPLPTP